MRKSLISLMEGIVSVSFVHRFGIPKRITKTQAEQCIFVHHAEVHLIGKTHTVGTVGARWMEGKKMADMMMFPETVDEFMEKYKIVDSDEVYTNGVELVPIFRMKQWFEHVDTDPVKHGHWVIDTKFGADVMSGEQMVICSVCGRGIFWGRQNYCPHCGSKMDVSDTDVGKMEEEEE